MDRQLVVKNLDGEDLTIDVFDIIKDTDSNKEFICYAVDGDENVFISSLVETESGYTLDEVTDEEKKVVEEYLNKNIEEGKYE